MHLAATAHARTSACGSFEANRLYGSEGGVAKAIPTPIRSCARRRSDRAAGTGGCSAGPNQRMGPRKPYLAVPVTHSWQRGGSQQGIDGVMLSDQGEHVYPANAQVVANLATKARLPLISSYRITTEHGGLMAYAHDHEVGEANRAADRPNTERCQAW